MRRLEKKARQRHSSLPLSRSLPLAPALHTPVPLLTFLCFPPAPDPPFATMNTTMMAKRAPAPAKKAAAKTSTATKGGKGECLCLCTSNSAVCARRRPTLKTPPSSLTFPSTPPRARPTPALFSPGNYFRGSADAALSKWYGE